MIRLSITAGPHQGREFRFQEHDTFLFGRSREVHCSLPDDSYLSRMHFLIEVNPPLCQLQDLNSKNGTLVNGNKVQSVALRHGDEISVGVTRIRVEMLADLPPREPSLATRSLPPSPLAGNSLLRKLPELPLPEQLETLLDHQADLWERGQGIHVEHYLRDLPHLANMPDLLVPLLAQEIELRREAGESVELGQYQKRFPRAYAQLREELARQEQAAQLAGKLDPVGTVESPRMTLEGDGPPPTPGELSLPGYQFVRKLGEGGMGVVYQALDSRNQFMAIKMIRPAITPDRVTLARFLRETEIVRQLRHPNIVAYRDSGEQHGMLYFVMDYVEGTDAQRHVAKLGRLPVAQSIRWTLQLLKALEYAHSRGFVHRDIKPANLLVDLREKDERILLTDFGLARTYNDSQLSGLTCTGATGGTLGYLAPEQILNFREAKPASDQYAAAATLYHLLTGEHIYDRKGSSVEILKQVLSSEPVDIRKRRPELSPALRDVIHRALTREPEKRYDGVTAFAEALIRLLGSGV